MIEFYAGCLVGAISLLVASAFFYGRKPTEADRMERLRYYSKIYLRYYSKIYDEIHAIEKAKAAAKKEQS